MNRKVNTAAPSSPSHDLLAEASLFLDLDGTLVEIASRPDAVVVDDRLRSLLSRLSLRLAGRIAIISGRPVAQIRSFFPDVSLVIAGSHGIEICWPDGRITSPAEPSAKLPLLDRIRAFEREHPGVLVERKPFGVALHYRLAPEEEQACRQFAADAAQTWGYTLQSGKKVIELKMAATDKGDAVMLLMGMPPMQGARPVFIGDDDTDEAGFRAARHLGGAGILVGSARPSAADYRLDTVDQTLQWLEAAAGFPS